MPISFKKVWILQPFPSLSLMIPLTNALMHCEKAMLMQSSVGYRGQPGQSTRPILLPIPSLPSPRLNCASVVRWISVTISCGLSWTKQLLFPITVLTALSHAIHLQKTPGVLLSPEFPLLCWLFILYLCCWQLLFWYQPYFPWSEGKKNEHRFYDLRLKMKEKACSLLPWKKAWKNETDFFQISVMICEPL